MPPVDASVLSRQCTLAATKMNNQPMNYAQTARHLTGAFLQRPYPDRLHK